MTVLDVHPVGYDTAARTFGEDIAGGIDAAAGVLLADLSACYGMAGNDDTAQAWAPHYDDSARSAARAFTDLTNAAFRLAALLEQCAINYAGAEAACLPHQTAQQSQARWAHLQVAPTQPPPPAAGLSLPEPDGWSLLAHLIGRLWPDGHQDRLHHAAHAWHTAAATLRDLGPVLDRAVAQLAAEQHAPEVADAVTVLDQYGTTLAALAAHCAGLGDACDALAHHIDQAHSQIIHQCAEFVEITVAAEAAGGLLCAFTAGLSEAAAQAVVARAGIAAAATIRNAIDALASVAVGVAADLDMLAARLAALSREVEPVLARTVQPARVVRPGVVGVERTSVSAVPDSTTAIARLDSYAAAPERVTFGHADIHQFPGVKLRKSQFFDDVDVQALSDTRGVRGTERPNGNVVYVMHAEHAIGIDRTTGLETNVYTVVRSPSGEEITMYPGTSRRS